MYAYITGRAGFFRGILVFFLPAGTSSAAGYYRIIIIMHIIIVNIIIVNIIVLSSLILSYYYR